jgi:hypothetical protein
MLSCLPVASGNNFLDDVQNDRHGSSAPRTDFLRWFICWRSIADAQGEETAATATGGIDAGRR